MAQGEKNLMRTNLFQRIRSILSFIAVSTSFLGFATSIANSAPVTFYYEATVNSSPGSSLPLAIGQRIHGNYTFELNTPATSAASSNTFTRYASAITSMTVIIDGVGTGSGVGGDILIGAPVQTTGSYNYLSHQYDVEAYKVTGFSISGSFGSRALRQVFIQLQDIDMTALSSEALSATPPNLAPFMDHTGTSYLSDHAYLGLTFDFPSGGVNTTMFQLTSLSAVPEPSVAIRLRQRLSPSFVIAASL